MSNSDDDEIGAYLSGASSPSPFLWRGLDIGRLCHELGINFGDDTETALLKIISGLNDAERVFEIRCSIQSIPGGATRQKSAAKVQRFAEKVLTELKEPKNCWIEVIGGSDAARISAFAGADDAMERGHIVIQLMEWLTAFARSVRQKKTSAPRNKRSSATTWLLGTALPKIFDNHIVRHVAVDDSLSEKLKADQCGEARNRFVVRCARALGIVTELGAMKRRRQRGQKATPKE